VGFAGHASGMFPRLWLAFFGVLLYSGGFFNGTGREAFYSKKNSLYSRLHKNVKI
jgi:hypothetical protein